MIMGIRKVARRTFLGVATVGVGAVAFGYWQYKNPYDNPLEADLADGEATFTPFIKIARDNTITVIAPRAEMGQGVQTTLATLAAEELDVPVADLVVVHGPPAAAYYNAALMRSSPPMPDFDDSMVAELARSSFGVVGKFLGMQVTGGSSSMADGYTKMRKAGAGARMVLTQAAAERWGVSVDTLTTADGRVTDPASGQTATYGALIDAAAELDMPSNPRLRPRSEWTQLGKPVARVDLRDKVTGGAIFGIDVELPDMLHATVKMSPRFGAKALSVDKTAALATPGVRDVVEIETTTGSGFGIIADNTWAAFQGAEALTVEWGAAPYPENDTGIRRKLVEAIQSEPTHALTDRGDVDSILAAGDVLEAEYSVPYLAHATMEPMNATAQIGADGILTLWIGTQAPQIVQMRTAHLLGIETDDVTINVTHLGGGFGRRAEVDAPLYAASIAQHTNGRPVKVTWTREEDTRHDTYRPAALARMRAHVPVGEAADAVEIKIAVPSVMKSLMARTFPNLPMAGPDKTMTEGAFNQPEVTPHLRVSAHDADVSIPIGFWRAVGNSYSGFFHQGFMDEMAERAGMDPLAYRLASMGDDARFEPARNVLNRVAEMADWRAPMPDGVGKGIAHVASFGSWVAVVVEVDARGGDIRLTRCFICSDTGVVLDPRILTDQLTGGAIFGFSAAMGQEITFEDGQVQQGNFWDYGMMSQTQAPEFFVEMLETSPHIGGAGEISTPPAIPALANAIYAATGTRLRQMPFTRDVSFSI